MNRQSLHFGILTLLAAIPRLLGLNTRPIWYDEAFSMLFASHGPVAMLAGTLSAGGPSAEEHPLLYYTLLWGWQHLFGTGSAAARLLSVAAGLATVWLGYALSKSLFGQKTAYAATVILALSPFLTHYAQEIRMYALLAVFTTAATLAYINASKSSGKTWWIIFAVCSAASMYTHALAAFYLLALATIPVWQREWRNTLYMLASGLLALVLYLPWLVNLPSQFAKIQGNYWIERPGIEKIFTSLLSFVVNLPLPGAALPTGLAITCIVIAIALKQNISEWQKQLTESRQAAWLLYLSTMPMLLMLIVSQKYPIFIERALLPSGVMFCIWLGWALYHTPMPQPVRVTITALLLTGFSIGQWIHQTYAGFPYGPYREMSVFISQNLQPNDLVVHSSKLTALPGIYFNPSLPQVFIADPPNSPTDTLARTTQSILQVQSIESPNVLPQNTQRVWLVIFESSIEEYQLAGFETHPHLAYFNRDYAQVELRTFGEVRLYLYEKSP